MGRIDELIRRHCPDGVKYRRLGELGEFVRGNGIQKKDFVDDGVGCIHYGQLYTHYGLFASETKSFISPEFAKGKRMAHPGNLVIATTSEDVEGVGRAVAWLGEEDIAVSNDAYIYRHKLDPKYVSYFFHSEAFQSQKRPFVTGAKVLRINGDSMAKIKIPVPPIEVQQEIVRILDSMCELEASLQAELEAREQQFEAYREHRFDTIGDDSRKSLGAIASLTKGRNLQKKDFAEDGVGCIHYGQIYTKFGTSTESTLAFVSSDDVARFTPVMPGDIVMAVTSETVEDVGKSVAWLGKDIIYTGAHSVVIRHEEDPKYLSHYFQTGDFLKRKRKVAQGAKVVELKPSSLAKIEIPIPSIEIQREIVEKLDAFEGLIQNLREEIELRHKQYEHYRDRLLSFEKKGA